MNKKDKEEHKVEEPRPADDEKQAQESKDQLLRALADFDNFRKSAAVEKEELSKFGNELLIKELLPVLDGLDKALEFSKIGQRRPDKRACADKETAGGCSCKIRRRGNRSHGKKFDPNFHEAISMKIPEKSRHRDRCSAERIYDDGAPEAFDGDRQRKRRKINE